MTDYTKTTNFASKDALPSGNANKIVKGTEINTEFDNIATAVTTKANIANPAFTGVVSFPDGSASNPSITNTGDTNAGLFFSAADTLAFSAGGTAQVVFADGVISPVTDSDVDLGTNSLRFKDAYVDSVTVTGNGAITGDLDVDGTIEFDALSGTGSVAITDILDEDDMASNSATALATQQSIKAYVIAQQDTVDSLSEVLALGNTTGDTDISVTDDTKVQFRDSAIYINSSADGQLDIVADTEIQIAATTVDINGAVALNGAVTGATNVTLSGELDAATGDFSGAVDIDGALDVAGTTNLDVVDIDGATQIDATVSVGVDDTGYDVKFFGATSGKSLLWDESADSLIVTGTTTMTGNSTVSGTLGVTGVLTGTSLDISGDIDVDGTTNLDVVDIDGAVDMASTLKVDTRVGIGVAAHASAALNITTSGTDQSIRFNNGSELGVIELNSDGDLNLWAHGDSETLNLKTGTGSGNNILSIVGSASTFTGTVTANAGVVVDNITIDGNEIDVGSGDLTLDVAGSIVLDAVGHISTPTAGTSNVKLGVNAGNSIASGGNYNTVVGDEAGTAITTGDYNTALGFDAGKAVDTGVQNTLIGSLAGDALTDADSNVAVGYGSLSSDTKGSRTVAIGRNALLSQNFTSATSSNSTAVGYEAGRSTTTGINNCFFGSNAGYAITDADDNVAIGRSALATDVLGSKSVAVGNFALQNQKNVDGSGNPVAADMHNVAVGHSAGNDITTGINNTFVGSLAGDATDDGKHNTAMGYLALSANCGDTNAALGYLALTDTTGTDNTAVGAVAGLEVTSGSNNTFLGHDAGRTGSPGGAVTTASNILCLGDENVATANIQVDWTVASDARDKTDFTALDLGLDFVKDLQPVTYKWDKRSKYGDKTADDYDLTAQTPDGTHKEDWLDIGFKAQEVEALEIAAGYNKDNNTNLVSSYTDDGNQMGLQYSKFVPILVKAIQEQQALIEALTARIETLEG